jgi:hypothetical protein
MEQIGPVNAVEALEPVERSYYAAQSPSQQQQQPQPSASKAAVVSSASKPVATKTKIAGTSWVEVQDRGKIFYFNSVTKEAVMSRPPDLLSIVEEPPAPWQKHFDDATSSYWYYNEETGESVWDLPK